MRVPEALQPARRGITLREIIGVALATALIWLFAEAETVTQTTAPSVVRFVASDNSQRLVAVADPGFNGSVDLALQGSRSAVDRAVAVLSKGVVVNIGSSGVPLTPGLHIVDLADVFQRSPAVQTTGVVIANADPSVVRISIDERVVLHDVPIMLDLPEVELQDPPVIEPSRADLAGPKALIDRFRAAGAEARLLARVAPEVVANLPQGEPRRIDARIVLPAGYDDLRQFSITPDIAAVTLTVRSVIDTIDLPLAPVHVLLPPPELSRWEVVVDPPFLSDLTISGPSWLIERVRTGALPVKGVVELTSEALEAGVASARVEFPLLPADMTVETPTRDVRLTIRRIDRPLEPTADGVQDDD